MARTPTKGKIEFQNILLPVPLQKIQNVRVPPVGRRWRTHIEIRSTDPPPKNRFRIFAGIQNRRHAERLARDLREAITRGTLPTTTKMLSEFSDEFLESVKVRLRWKTYLKYRTALNLLQAFLGDVALSSISRSDLLDFRDQRLRDGARARTVNNQIGDLRKAFDEARQRQYLSENPVHGIHRLPVDPLPKKRYSKAEIRGLLEQSPPWLQRIILFFLSTGLRLGQLYRLEWDWIDWENETLEIRYAKSTTRSTQGFDLIPLNAVAMAVLREQRAERRHRTRVFVGPSGKPLGHWLLHHVKSAAAAAGVEGANIHAFKRTFTNLLLEAGTDAKSTQELSQHTDPRVTMQVYAQADLERKRVAVDRIGQLLVNTMPARDADKT